MDISRFGEASPGGIVRIPGDHAFIPEPLPPNWKFPERLWPLLAETKHEIGILEGIGRNLPNPGLLLWPLSNREALSSSRLEGTYVKPSELLLFEMHTQEPRSEDDPANRQLEVFNYRKALAGGMNSDLPLSLRSIRGLHETLLLGVRGEDSTPGRFRTVQVAIGSASRFVPPPGERLMECLDPFEKRLHVTGSEYDPLVDCYLVHYQFETIHPFRDGNGRVGRLLLAIMLKDRCRLSKPWLYMSDYFEKHRTEYVERLFDVSASGNWEGWIEFCLNGTHQQTRSTIARCERLCEIREELKRKVEKAGGSIRLNSIVESLFVSPFIRVTEIRDRFNITYPTAKADLDRLVEAKILRRLPRIAPKTFVAPSIFDAVYGEMEHD